MPPVELIRIRMTTVLLRAAEGALTWRSPRVVRPWRRTAAAMLITVAWILWGAPAEEGDDG